VNILNRNVLVLGGYGLVGMAICRELLAKGPARLQVHSLRPEESEEARRELAGEWPRATIETSSGDIFALAEAGSRLDEIRSQLGQLQKSELPTFLLYRLLTDSRPDVVIDCVNTSTAIAYRDLYSRGQALYDLLAGSEGSRQDEREAAEKVLEALYVPRLIRHVQVLYQGMIEAGTRVYLKIGTTGTGGMGLNIPYTHSEERPSRVLLSKSAMAGAQSMLLFLMARTPGAPITKEIKPAAAIAWKKIAHGPVVRRGKEIKLVDARPRPLGETFSSHDDGAADVRDEPLRAAYIDTGENGIFSLEEFAALTTAEQMEFVTPEEIARYSVHEIEGGNTGHDVVNALDNAVLGPTYRAGLLRHWALERMIELQKEHGTASVAFEMLGPPRVSKLLFEAHLLRQAFGTMEAVNEATPEVVRDRLNALVREQPEVANEVAAVGIPLLLDSGELVRGQEVIVPKAAVDAPVTPAAVDAWAHDGWVDLRLANCTKWVERFRAIDEEMASIPEEDTSSRFMRNRRFWHEDRRIQPGKVVGWILSVEEEGARMKR
jgi:NAD(P)-dependent dehydrogenase (short-subunit alcohol dehydrogenase family)